MSAKKRKINLIEDSNSDSDSSNSDDNTNSNSGDENDSDRDNDGPSRKFKSKPKSKSKSKSKSRSKLESKSSETKSNSNSKAAIKSCVKSKNNRKKSTAPKKLTKSDLIQIAILRWNSNPVEVKQFRSKKVTELQTLLNPISEIEHQHIANLKVQSKTSGNKDEKLSKMSRDDLKKTLMMAGLGKCSGLNKEDMMNLIVQKQLQVYRPIEMDPDQKDLINTIKKSTTRADIKPLSLTTAGPGSGKTLTLAKLAATINEKFPQANILICMFNVAAEASCNQRIEIHGGKLRKSNNNLNLWQIPAGIYCMTFNKLAWRVLYPTGSNGSSSTFSKKRKLNYNNRNNINDDKSSNNNKNNNNNNPESEDYNPFDDNSNDNVNDYQFNNTNNTNDIDEIDRSNCYNDNDNDDDNDNGNDNIYDDTRKKKHLKGKNIPIIPLDKQIPAATEVLRQKPIKIDFLLIDEAQDIQTKIEDFTKILASCAKHVIYAGDPRQEVISGAQFFSNLWTTTAEENKNILHYNHRSHPKIVEMLNAYSKLCFPTLHHDQTADYMRNQKQNQDTKLPISTIGKTNEKSQVKINEIFKNPKSRIQKHDQDQDQSVSNQRSRANFLKIVKGQNHDNIPEKEYEEYIRRQRSRPEFGVEVITAPKENLAQCISQELLNYSPRECYIITPVTVKKYKFEQLYMNVRNALGESNDLDHLTPPLVVLNDESQKFKPGENVYYCGNSKKLKGTEIDYAILVGCEIPYMDINISESEFKKALFVCLSRAIKKVIIILPENAHIQVGSIMHHIMKFDQTSTFQFMIDPSSRVKSRNLLTSLKVKDDISNVAAVSIVGKLSVYSPAVGHQKNGKEEKMKLRLLDDASAEQLRIPNNEDFVGLYIEALVAIKFGADSDINRWTAILEDPDRHFRILNYRDTKVADENGTFLDINEMTNNYILSMRCPTVGNETKDDYYRGLYELKELSKIDLGYVLCVLHYSSQIGKWWVASRCVFDVAQKLRTELDTLIDSIPPYLGIDILQNDSSTIAVASVAAATSGDENKNDNENENTKDEKTKLKKEDEKEKKKKIIWGYSIESKLKCYRSKKQAGEIKGICDLIIIDHKKRRQIILEIKYGHHRESHIRQTSIYADMILKRQKLQQQFEQSDEEQHLRQSNTNTNTNTNTNMIITDYKIETKLINLLEGKTWNIEPINSRYLNDWTRATLAAKNGKNSRSGKRILVPGITGSILIPLDVETVGLPIATSPLLEISAAAWYFGNDVMENVFSETISGASFIEADGHLETETIGVRDLKNNEENEEQEEQGEQGEQQENENVDSDENNNDEKQPGLQIKQKRKEYNQNQNQNQNRKNEKLKWCRTSHIHGICPDPQLSLNEESQTKLKNSFLHWFDSIPGRKIILSWGTCDDPAAAGMNEHPDNETIVKLDLQKLYKDFLLLNGMERRTSTRLCDAIDHLFPSYKSMIQYHRAFDDVVGTILIANAILDFGSCL